MGHTIALLRKNLWLKKRHPIATFFEILCPALVFIAIVIVRSREDRHSSMYVPGWQNNTLFGRYGNDYGSSNDYSGVRFREPGVYSLVQNARYASRSIQDCVKSLAMNGSVDATCQKPLSLRPKLAIVPDNTFTRAYLGATLAQWYPKLSLPLKNANGNLNLTISGLADFLVYFDSEAALEAYVTAPNYGPKTDYSWMSSRYDEDKNATYNPTLVGAIVFNQMPSEDEIGTATDIEYTLRFPRADDSYMYATQKTTGAPPTLRRYDPLTVDLFNKETALYTTQGFATLDTMLTRVLNCRPVWDAATKRTNGTCSVAASTATSSADSALRAIVNADIQRIVGGLPLDYDMTRNVSVSETLLPPDVLSSLLRPLRQAPQPFLGGVTDTFPTGAYGYDYFLAPDNVAALAICLGTVVFSVLLLGNVVGAFVLEKETRTREFMQALGLRPSSLVLSWFLLYSVLAALIALLQTLLAVYGDLFRHSSALCVFGLLFAFGLTLIGFGFCASTLFTSAKTATYSTQLVFLLLSIVAFALSDEMTEATKVAACLLPPTALVLGLQVIIKAEHYTRGITLANAGALQANRVRFSTTVGMLFLDAIWLTLLGLYLDGVTNGQSWFFPLQPSYWRAPTITLGMASAEPNQESVDIEAPEHHLAQQEKDGRALVVSRLHKTFGPHVAVDNLSLTFYEGQITCLLGHNGAGKTTAISMLTGMLRPTAGDATVHGLALSKDLRTMQRSMGVCPQHNILYEDLTVSEHLRFYAAIKGVADVAAAVTATLSEVDLVDKANDKVKALSGGMKRKLSVGIALLGNSSVVFLDEPTSGMDPYSRRSVWELLLRNRSKRIMILTTHYMEEADVLGDRIAIMANGALQCVGSALFLKNRFGAGYTLTLVKVDASSAMDAVSSLVLTHVPSAILTSNVASEVSFQLPTHATSAFPDLFAALDDDLPAYGLSSYGISVTTLEDVFIKVTSRATVPSAPTTASVAVPIAPPVLVAHRTFLGQTLALLGKRFHVAKRDKRAFFNTTLLPVLLIAIGFGVMKYMYERDYVPIEPRLVLDASQYPDNVASPTPFACLTTSPACAALFSSATFTGSTPQEVPYMGATAYTTPTANVFGYTYGAPTAPPECRYDTMYRGTDAPPCLSAPANLSGTQGFELRFGETLYNRSASSARTQMGGYLMHVSPDENVWSYVLFANASSSHAAPVYKRLLHQALYRTLGGSSSLQLMVASHPLPTTFQDEAARVARRQNFGDTMGYLGLVCFIFALSFFPAGIMTFLVKEKQLTAKQQQLASGVYLSAFWVANLIWDVLSFLPVIGILLGLILGFRIRPYTSEAAHVVNAFSAVSVLFLLSGVSLILLTYVGSFFLKEPTSAQSITVIVNWCIGFGFLVIEVLIKSISYEKSGAAVWRISPLYALGDGLMNITESRPRWSPNASEMDVKIDALSPAGVLMDVYYLIAMAFVFALVVAVLEYRVTFRIPKPKKADAPGDRSRAPLDVDVAAEASRVAALAPADSAVTMTGLRKVFTQGLLGRPTTAVDNLSIALPAGECFGFLGVNGAGKSTTLKMLLGEVLPTDGAAYLGGLHVIKDQNKARQLVGYCPQFDALFDLLSVREHLVLYASLRGLQGGVGQRAVTALMEKLHLGAFEHVLASNLSGGNKRKLSVAIAMIGSPPIIVLDEPSTGMDPVSRRFMWELISDLSTNMRESTVLLTTHSMEECEALCSRVGIMAAGVLRCLGSIQYLKSRFGHGLVLDVKQALPTDAEVSDLMTTHAMPMTLTMDAMIMWCTELGRPDRADALSPEHPTGFFLEQLATTDGQVDAPSFCTWWLCEDQFDALVSHVATTTESDADVVVREGTFARLKLPTSLGVAFGLVEGAKDALRIVEYSVSQTSLEAIFNSLASLQPTAATTARTSPSYALLQTPKA
ncbi:hypothetical protein SPRG_13556 [Saprolegnia parasitica CBS 223.65]|uniref:ABC transporter domain-containing protein n=1 Tax=Saprolegnia parasitica (strain CBS 223.65) TaxID=695850 RepID=A0A067C393_SAPPC|nr:hypothetical protein SPRG_13556 [Saprolegnia parasitica CBS 223.65]KDO21257.1 hypothetical protein SPRG_13556 [Saprolegnia parasitica CBS 223.65]|eukprot:XP_012208001.1 hypothetical protein SPRG_13556 [Saprolegnia parasitica CBS 223.65]